MTAALILLTLAAGLTLGACWENLRPGGTRDQARDKRHAEQQVDAHRHARRPVTLTPAEQAAVDQLETQVKLS